MCFFFFFKQKTADEMRISDWSSDVCSSDLQPFGPVQRAEEIAFQNDVQRDDPKQRHGRDKGRVGKARIDSENLGMHDEEERQDETGKAEPHGDEEIGRASCRERVGQYE